MPEQLGLLSEMFNFTVSYRVNRDAEWGKYIGDNGSWTGLMGMLSRREVDVASAGLSQSLERSLAVDFTQSTLMDEITLIGRAVPDRGKANTLAYLAVFTGYSWMSFGAILAAYGVLVMSVKHLAVNDDLGLEEFTFLNCLGFLGMYLIQLEYPRSRGSGDSLRIVCLFLSYSCHIVFLFYGAVMTSKFTVSSPPAKIESLMVK